ncbi:hypothetical protein [Ammoniphilus sp. 3BR4]|uniref:hypothetical protein n=1 Tax=Ammoniphilus sp. 3BR4 TaxID=3158265 RepID=UPI00346678A9
MKITKDGVKEKLKKKRVGGPYLNPDTYNKADRLARVLGIGIPQLLEEMAVMLLNHPSWVNHIQDKHGVSHNDSLRLTPITENGRITY